MSDLDSKYFDEIIQLGRTLEPNEEDQEQAVIGRARLCHLKRQERKKDLGITEQAHFSLVKTPIPKSEALRMLDEAEEDLTDKLNLVKTAKQYIKKDHAELQGTVLA